MHAALSKIVAKSREGMANSQVEFGTIQNISPLTIKLDTDPTPFEAGEIVLFKGTTFMPEDNGARVALLACSNGQYLLLGEVE